MTGTSQTRSHGLRCIEDCRGDFEELSQLIERSWADNAQQPLFYGGDFLASCFEYPGASVTLAPAIYEGALPLAFGAAFPRRVRLAGRELKLAVVTLLTVAGEYKKRGYGIVLWNEIVKRAQAMGFDGIVNYCVQGESMDGMILGCCKMLKLPTIRIVTIPYWSRMLQPRMVQDAGSTPDPGVVERFLGLTAPIVGQTPLARLWSLDEAEWQCHRRFGSIVSEVECGSRRGMLVGYTMPVANVNRTKCLMVEDVLWGDLEPQERDSLVKTFLDRAVLAGAQIAVVPVLGYADLRPFHTARFRPSNKILHAYLTVWNGEPFAKTLPSMYLDVF